MSQILLELYEKSFKFHIVEAPLTTIAVNCKPGLLVASGRPSPRWMFLAGALL